MKKKKLNKTAKGIPRRHFIKASGTLYVAAVVGCAKQPIESAQRTLHPDEIVSDHPPSEGYLVVDRKKCQGCLTCMLACSLAHHGYESLTLSRIQIIQNPFGKFPDDLSIEQCRQCVDPKCIAACEEKAGYIDKEHGNVRTVNADLCVGCMECVNSCPHLPSRAIWDREEQGAYKCDLCADIPHWNRKGGPGGVQTCVEVCPVSAIKFQSEIPVQEGDLGYEVNLRGKSWEKLGYSADD